MSSDPAVGRPLAVGRQVTSSHGPNHGPVIGIVGAGAAGTLVAIHLLRELRASDTAADVVLIDPAESGRGVAYATPDVGHLLNVAVGRMSALPDVPEHLLEWARCQSDSTLRDATADDFLPRRSYGAYLRDTLDHEIAHSARPRLLRRRERAVTLEPGSPTDAHPHHRISLADGTSVVVDHVVLAPGIFAPGTAWAPPALLTSDRFVADPWAPGALAAIEDDGDVLLVGTGLTMVDVATTLARTRSTMVDGATTFATTGRVLHAVSRRGRLPKAHGPRRLPAVEPTDLPVDLDIETLRRVVLDHVRTTARTQGDWRPAMDGMRPHTARLWSMLCDECRREFLRTDALLWDTHRHRMPRVTAASIARMRADGALTVAAAHVLEVEDVGGALLVQLSDGTSRRVAHVVNCTGPQPSVAHSRDPLLTSLLAAGHACAGPLDMGLATDAEGRVRAADGAVGAVWTLGALRRGELWESNAIPEIRSQAVAVAQAIATQVAAASSLTSPPAASASQPPQVLVPRPGPPPSATRSAHTPRVQASRKGRSFDLMGLPLTTSAAAADAYNVGLGRVLRVQSGADAAFREAVTLDPGFALGHAALALLGHEGGATADVAASLAAAQAAVRRRGDDRERSLVDVVTSRVQDCRGTGAAALVGHIGTYPRDALAVSAAVPTIAFSGVTDVQQEAWTLVESLAPAYGDDWWFSGLLAFVRQDQGRYDEADALAWSALRVEPAAGHAVHAQTHVFYETGQHIAGLEWLDPWIASSGQGASHRAHFSWHAALHELSMGNLDAVRSRYDRELAPPHVTGVRALVDSASLLWRCRVTESWAGDLPLTSLLELVGTELLERPATPFTAMHSAVALAAAGDCAGLVRLRGFVAASPEPVMSDVVVSLCDALVAVLEQRWNEAVRILRLLGPWLVQLGGSAAQREIVEDTLLYALVAAGRCDEARGLLEARLDRRPSPLDTQRLASVPA
jgi:uncharacterized NAD(P)/FAD-binding protein YdhS